MGEREEGEGRGDRPARKLRWKALLPLGLPLLVFLWSGLRGIDFGEHWDERLHVVSVTGAVRKGTLLPASYNYPSMCFWVCVLGIAPELVRDVEVTNRDAAESLKHAANLVKTREYSLRMRGLFVVLTSLSLVWVYLLVLFWRGSWLEATCAASILGFSWELGYHARWLSPDPLLVMFTALSLFVTGMALRAGSSRRWLLAAALAAGLACGTKYQGGILLVPVLLAAWYRARVLRSDASALRSALQVVLLFGATYLVITPGTLLQPVEFLQGLRYEIRHYRTGQYGYTIEGGLEHFTAISRYIGAHLLSPYAPGALLLVALALVGAAALWRESRPLTLLLVGLPLFVILYMAPFRTFFVRNLLWTAPALAVLAARGTAWIVASFRPGWPRALAAAPVALLLAANAVYLVGAGESIRERRTDRFARELAEHLSEHPEPLYYLTPRVAAELTGTGAALPARFTSDPGAGADVAVFYPAEIKRPTRWSSNVPGRFLRTFGPRDVNFDYYTTWLEPRIVLVGREQALELGALR